MMSKPQSPKQLAIERICNTINLETGDAPSLEALEFLRALQGDKQSFKTMMVHLSACCQEVLALPEAERPSWWWGIYYLSLSLNEYMAQNQISLDKAFGFEKGRGRPKGGDGEYQVMVGLTAYQEYQSYITQRGTKRGAREAALLTAIHQHKTARSFTARQLQRMLKPMFGPDSLTWGEFYLLLFSKRKSPQK